MTTDKTYHAEATTLDGGHIERTFEGCDALKTACLFAQGIEEDGGTAYVTDETGETVDHWAGYRLTLVPNGTDDSIGLAFEVLDKTSNRE